MVKSPKQRQNYGNQKKKKKVRIMLKWSVNKVVGRYGNEEGQLTAKCINSEFRS